jgi:hypothetical protein
LNYSFTAKHVDYTDTTIYFKTEEMLFGEGVSVSYNTVKPWGSINTSISGDHYFHDFSKKYNFAEYRTLPAIDQRIIPECKRIRLHGS